MGDRRLVAEDDEARLVAAALADREEGAHSELAHLVGAERLRGQVLVLGGERCGAVGERRGCQLVRRLVREVARAVRAVGDDRRSLDGRAQLGRLLGADHDLFERLRLLLRLPAAGRVRAEDRALDERRRLLGERHRQRLVELPDERAADAGERLGCCSARCSERVRVDVVPLADSHRRESRRGRVAVEVEENRLATLAPQLAGLAESREAVVELSVQRLGDGHRERVRAGLLRLCESHRRHRAMLARRGIDSPLRNPTRSNSGNDNAGVLRRPCRPGRHEPDGGNEQLVRLRHRGRGAVDGEGHRGQRHGRGRHGRRRRLHDQHLARRSSRRSSPGSRTRRAPT